MREMSFCAVATASHLRYSIALNRSIQRYHPSERLIVLLVDPPTPRSCAVREIEVVTPQDIGIPDYDRLTVTYDAFTLSCNLKPVIIDYVLRTYSRKTLYLDSDILVTGPLDGVMEILDRSWFALTPHVLRLDRLGASRVPVAQFVELGVYNGGMWGVRGHPDAFRMLDWLKSFFATTDLPFADQKALVLAAQLAGSGFATVSDPGYNVAYWNLHERTVERVGGNYRVDGQPATFFHLSGFDDRFPERFSRHCAVTANELNCYREVLKDFLELIPPDPELRGLGYRFDLHNSRRLSPEMRRHFQRHGTLAGFREAQLKALLRSAYGKVRKLVS